MDNVSNFGDHVSIQERSLRLGQCRTLWPEMDDSMKNVQKNKAVAPGRADGGSRDRRVARTRKSLTEALIGLLLETGWERIGVGDLCERADVSRSTFYLHYANKEELLESGFAALRDTLQTGAGAVRQADGGLGFVAGLAAHLYENRRAFLAILSSNGGNIVRERFRILLVKLVLDELGPKGNRDVAAAQFLAGGFVSLAAHFLSMKKSRAEDLALEFNRLAAAVINASRARRPEGVR